MSNTKNNITIQNAAEKLYEELRRKAYLVRQDKIKPGAKTEEKQK